MKRDFIINRSMLYKNEAPSLILSDLWNYCAVKFEKSNNFGASDGYVRRKSYELISKLKSQLMEYFKSDNKEVYGTLEEVSNLADALKFKVTFYELLKLIDIEVYEVSINLSKEEFISWKESEYYFLQDNVISDIVNLKFNS